MMFIYSALSFVNTEILEFHQAFVYESVEYKSCSAFTPNVHHCPNTGWVEIQSKRLKYKIYICCVEEGSQRAPLSF